MRVGLSDRVFRLPSVLDLDHATTALAVIRYWHFNINFWDGLAPLSNKDYWATLEGRISELDSFESVLRNHVDATSAETFVNEDDLLDDAVVFADLINRLKHLSDLSWQQCVLLAAKDPIPPDLSSDWGQSSLFRQLEFRGWASWEVPVGRPYRPDSFGFFIKLGHWFDAEANVQLERVAEIEKLLIDRITSIDPHPSQPQPRFEDWNQRPPFEPW